VVKTCAHKRKGDPSDNTNCGIEISVVVGAGWVGGGGGGPASLTARAHYHQVTVATDLLLG